MRKERLSGSLDKGTNWDGMGYVPGGIGSSIFLRFMCEGKIRMERVVGARLWEAVCQLKAIDLFSHIFNNNNDNNNNTNSYFPKRFKEMQRKTR